MILSVLTQYFYMFHLPWERDLLGFAAFAFFALLFSVLGYLLRKERTEKKAFENKLLDIKEGVRTFFSDDEGAMLALKEEKRIETLQNTFTFFEDRVFKIIEQVKELMDPYTVAFMKLKDDGGYYKVFEAISDNDFIKYNEDINLEEGIVGWIHKYSKSLNMGNFKGGFKSLNYYDKDVPVKSFLGMPVYWKDRMVGVLTVDSLQEDAFSAESEHIVKLSAMQIEDALENAQLIQQIQQQSKEFGALYDASKKMLSFVSLSDNLSGFLDLVGTFVTYETAMICLMDDAEVLRVRAFKGLKEDIVDRAVDENSLIHWVVEHKQYLDLKRYGEKNRTNPLIAQNIKIPNFSRVIIYPLVIEGRTIGSFVLGFKNEGLSEYEKSILEILTNQACIAVSNAMLFEKVSLMATTDGLTGINNHRHFQDRLTEILERAKRYDERFALILMDIDFFKRVNDTYGHPVGDVVLKKVSNCLMSLARKVDVVARYGGEEFAIIMVQNNKEGAYKFAERLRKEVETMSVIFDAGKVNVTVSMGIAGYPEDGQEKSKIIESADSALYKAKESGRNKVVEA
jgi:two-component system cell cycle response regulator